MEESQQAPEVKINYPQPPFDDILNFKPRTYYKEKRKERAAKYKANPASKKFNFPKWDNVTDRVLKNIHTDLTLSYEAKCLMNHYNNALEQKIIEVAVGYKNKEGADLLTSKHMIQAAATVIEGDLFVHAQSEMNRAVNKFNEHA
jgi:hypothetical protein